MSAGWSRSSIVLGFLAADPGDRHDALRPRRRCSGSIRAAREGDRVTGPFSAAVVPRLHPAAVPLHARRPALGAEPARARRRGPAQVDEHHRGCAPAPQRRPLPPRQHGLPGCARGAVRLRRHLRRRRVRLGATELGIFGILLTVTGTVGRARRRPARRPVRREARDPRRHRGPGRRLRRHAVARARPHPVRRCRPRRLRRRRSLRQPLPKRCSSRSASSSAPSPGRCRPPRAACWRASCRPREAGRYFGLLALSGKVTSFLAPLAVAVATDVFQTQAAGPAVLILFFARRAAWPAERRASGS